MEVRSAEGNETTENRSERETTVVKVVSNVDVIQSLTMALSDFTAASIASEFIASASHPLGSRAGRSCQHPVTVVEPADTRLSLARAKVRHGEIRARGNANAMGLGGQAKCHETACRKLRKR